MAIEVYNRPTVKSRVEGFSFFICNAWELMLKAKILRDEGRDELFYKDNPGRTKDLERCISMVGAHKATEAGSVTPSVNIKCPFS